MSVTIEIPSDLEQRLRGSGPELGEQVREVYALWLFRHGSLTHAELGRMLGLDRIETDALLKRHDVAEHALTHAEVDADVEGINDLIGPPQR
ncbi:MAG: UPF0175 family protein [Gemmataceae bacterium]|nr:UPF0175 family protein [Gemmataceae bacterium]